MKIKTAGKFVGSALATGLLVAGIIMLTDGIRTYFPKINGGISKIFFGILIIAIATIIIKKTKLKKVR